MSTRQMSLENIQKFLAMDLVYHRNKGILHFPRLNFISYGEMNEKRSNRTTQELVCNYHSESVLCSVNQNMDI
jgi:hypothetical protein